VHERGKLEYDKNNKAITLKGSVQDITEEKLKELSLAQHANFIASTLDHLPVGIAVNRISDGKTNYINPRFSEIYGWPEESLKDVDSFFRNVYNDRAYRRQIKKRILEDIQSGDPGRMEWKDIEITTSKGENRVINAKNIPLFGQDLMISTVTDETASHAISNELKAMNERFRFVSRATSDTIWDRNLLKKELYWGENYTKNLGYKNRGNPGNSYLLWFNRLHPEDRERVEASFSAILKGSSDKWACQYRYKHCNHNNYLYVHDRGFILRDEKGNAIRMVGAMQDVTEKYLQEQRLKLFESVVASSNDAIVITEAEPLSAPEGPRITYVNGAFEKMTGYSAKEVLGKTPRFLQGPKSDPGTIELMGSQLRKFKNVDVEILNYTKNGEEFWVNLAIVPIKNSKGDFTYFISVQREINLVKAEKENRELIQQLSLDFTREEKAGTLFKRIATTIGGKINSEAVELWMINKDKSAIELASFYGRQQETEALKKYEDKLSFKKGEGLPGMIWQKKRRLVRCNLTLSESGFARNEMARELGINSAYGVPLLLEDQVIGTLVIYSASTSGSYEELMAKRLQGLDYYLGAEIQRKKVQEQLEAIIQSVPDIICLADSNGYFKKVNESATDILGYRTEELIGHRFSEFVHPEDLAPSNEKMEEVASGKYLKYFENRYICKNGEIVWLAWSSNPADSEGNHLSVGKDITERKKAMDQIRLSHERFRIASEATNDAIWEWDRASDSLIWMEGFKRLFGYEPRNDYHMEDWMSKVHPEDLPGVLAHMNEELQNPERKVIRDEYRFKRKDGSYTVVIDHAQIIRNREQEVIGMIGAIQDITERKSFEKELLHLNQSLKEKNEQLALSNTELEHFAYVASHDLQEPLRMISGFLTQLNKKYGRLLDEKAQTYIHYAVDGAARMRTIIQELLQYSRLGRQQEAKETVHIGEIVEGVEALYRSLISETGAKIRKPSRLPTIRSYRVLLFQVFQNLIDNALKYRKAEVAPLIEISFKPLDGHWLFKVSDNGIGIDPQYHDKIFAIFQRLHSKSEYEGTGMGLTNTKKIVESLGGSIYVESEVGRGSEFTFTIKDEAEKE
jgi:PAS domain S-box-containing protein